MQPTEKPFYLSKTLWVNALMIVAVLFPDTRELLGEENIGAVIGAVNVLLRLVTKDKLIG